MFAGFFILLFIGVNTGNYLLYTLFARTLTTEINLGSRQTLEKIKNATELMYDEIIAISTQLGHGNITITKMMFEKERDRLLEYQAHRILQNALVSYPYIDYLAVYNERLDEIFGTRYFSPSSEEEFKRLAGYYYRRDSYRLTIPLAVQGRLTDTDNGIRNTVTLIIYSPLSLEHDKGALLVGISCDYFQQLIRKMDEGNLETIMILHGNGRVISHPDGSRRLLNYRDKDYLEPVWSDGRDLKDNGGDDNFGFFVRNIDSTETHISYVRSGVLDWIFINMIPWKKMSVELVFFRNITLVITGIILCAGLFISYLLALRMYRPVRQILKRLNYHPPGRNSKNNENLYIEQEIDYLRSTADRSETLVRTTVVFDLLKNQYIDDDVINKRVIATAFREPYYLVCVVSWDDGDGFESLGSGEQGIQRNRLIKTAMELLGGSCAAVDHAVLSSTDIALVLHLETGAVPDNLSLLIRETGETMRKFHGRTISAALGPIVSSIFAINDSFEEAEELLKERFFRGAETIVIRQPGKRTETDFPVRIGEELCRAVASGDTRKTGEAVNRFISALGKNPYEYARMHLNTVIMQLLSFCIMQKLPVKADAFHGLNGKLQKAETLEKTRILLSEFCLSLIQDSNRNTAVPLPPLIRDAVRLAAEKYRDPAFSLNTAAEAFNITPAYFNRLFKKYQQTSYSEFLNEYRLAKACEMLVETNEPVTAVSNAVGISNTTYFYTLFKKIHNCTPQQYRTTHSVR
jgi:AraC-like DNA-binding protein